jgi:hypothetical protein
MLTVAKYPLSPPPAPITTDIENDEESVRITSIHHPL